MRSNLAGRRLAQALIAVAAIAAIAAPGASAAGVIRVYPNGALNGFTSGLDGWTSASTGATAAAHDPSLGDPPGSLRAKTDAVAVSATGTGSFTSPAFTIPAGPTPTFAAMAFFARLSVGGVAPLAATSTTTVAAKLKDLTAATETELFSQNVPAFVAPFVDTWIPVPVQIPNGKILPGHNYQVVLSAATTATGLLSDATVRFDNVGLATQDPDPATPPPPGGGGGGSTGGTAGTVIAPPKTDAQMSALLASTNVNAETGPANLLGTSIPVTQCTIIGTQGKDNIKGTAGNDVICGFTGDDTIDGGGGNDIIDGGDGNDRLIGGAGIDGLVGVRGNDNLDGGTGNDRVGGGAGNDRVVGGSGNDRLGAGTGTDSLNGGTGADLLDAGSGNDRLDGGTGKDLIGGGAGNDRIKSKDKTRDRVDGGSGKDTATVDFKKQTKAQIKKKAKKVKLDLVLRVEKIR